MATPREESAAAAGGVVSWPTHADAYNLEKEIGKGAFAVVWKASCHERGGAPAAIKIMDLEGVVSGLEDIRQEVSVMRLCEHPNVVRCHCSFVHGNQLWLVMEFMDKGSCFHVMSTARRAGNPGGMLEVSTQNPVFTGSAPGESSHAQHSRSLYRSHVRSKRASQPCLRARDDARAVACSAADCVAAHIQRSCQRRQFRPRPGRQRQPAHAFSGSALARVTLMLDMAALSASRHTKIIAPHISPPYASTAMSTHCWVACLHRHRTG
jgi:Protein kinase domain